MKILIISQYFYPESFRVNSLAKELVNRGHSVTVLTGYPQYPYGKIYDGYSFNTPYDSKWNGVNIIRLKVSPRGQNTFGLVNNCISFVRKGYKWVKKCKDKYDVVYVFEVSPVTVGLPAIKYKKKFSTPVFFNVQDLWPENVIEVLGIKNKAVIGVINKIVDKIYTNSDRILCSSQGFVNNIEARGIDRNKLVFWPQFCIKPSSDSLRKPLCYDNSFFNITFTGNIGYAQGLELLVDAADLLRDKPVRWYIVGDGRAKDELFQKVVSKNLSEQIKFIGRVSESEADNYVRFADCAFLSFSDKKIFDLTIPAKLQTYLACGTPVLCAAGGESADIILSANCGKISSKTPEGVADKVSELMNMSAAERNEYRNNAQNYFNANFNMDKLINELESMFQEK